MTIYCCYQEAVVLVGGCPILLLMGDGREKTSSRHCGRARWAMVAARCAGQGCSRHAAIRPKDWSGASAARTARREPRRTRGDPATARRDFGGGLLEPRGVSSHGVHIPLPRVSDGDVPRDERRRGCPPPLGGRGGVQRSVSRPVRTRGVDRGGCDSGEGA